MSSDHLTEKLQVLLADSLLASQLVRGRHLFSADPEEGLPAELVETLQPGFFSLKEAKTRSLLGQKLLQGDRVAVRIAKVPAHLAIERLFVHGEIPEGYGYVTSVPRGLCWPATGAGRGSEQGQRIRAYFPSNIDFYY
jgi:hypothetical protein